MSSQTIMQKLEWKTHQIKSTKMNTNQPPHLTPTMKSPQPQDEPQEPLQEPSPTPQNDVANMPEVNKKNKKKRTCKLTSPPYTNHN
jgi:hypothetical protein